MHDLWKTPTRPVTIELDDRPNDTRLSIVNPEFTSRRGGALPYLGLIYLVILVIALIDIINTDESRVRGLPKMAWVILVVILPWVGALVWLAVGRPTADDLPRRPRGAASEFPEYDSPGRYVPTDPDADREFLQQLRDRAEEQRRTAREQERRRRERDVDPDAVD